jgi:hypothetical protein
VIKRIKGFAAFMGLVVAAGQLPGHSAGFMVRTGEPTTARLYHAATLLFDGRVLLTGGLTGDRHSAQQSAELYDPQTRTFSLTGSMKIPRWGHAAARLPDGRVLITGGYAGTEAEVYDPSTGTFDNAGQMTAVRSFHTATLLPDGRVLITGGHPTGLWVYVATAEVFDPKSGLFTPAADMTAARYNHRATLLTDGSVFIAPGSDGGDFETAETYDPQKRQFPLHGFR